MYEERTDTRKYLVHTVASSFVVEATGMRVIEGNVWFDGVGGSVAIVPTARLVSARVVT